MHHITICTEISNIRHMESYESQYVITEISDIWTAMNPHVINARRDRARHTSLINHGIMGIIKFYSLQCGFESTHWGNRDISRHRQTTLHVVWSTLVYFCISDDFRKDAAMLSKPHGRVLSINVINPFQQNCFSPISPLGETKSDWLFPFSQLTIDQYRP